MFKADQDVYAEIERINYEVTQSHGLLTQLMTVQEAIADRLMYLQRFIADKEDGYV